MKGLVIYLLVTKSVFIKWNPKNKKWYESRGYKFNGDWGSEFEVKTEDISPGSQEIIYLTCDYCKEEFNKIFNQYIRDCVKSENKKHCCQNCVGKKASESNKNRILKQYKEIKVSENYKDIIYIITEKINELDDYGKILIKDIQRFVEVNQRFPQDKDLTNKSGYISRTQFYDYFNSKNLHPVCDYIKPTYKIKEIITEQGEKRIVKIDDKPSKVKCIKCGIEKDFTAENFIPAKAQKFGLKYICRDCGNIEKRKFEYRKIGINFENFEDIPLDTWYECFLHGTIRQMPKHCFSENNLIEIVKYVILKKLHLKNKNEICTMFKRSNIEKYKIQSLIKRLGGKITTLKKCFPNFNFKESDFFRYDENEIDNIISNFINTNNLSIIDLLNKGISYKFTKEINALKVNQFKNNFAMFNWYFKRHNIKHPITNEEITIDDFEEKPSGFWSKKENRIRNIRRYCEFHGIQTALTNHTLLKEWIFSYFRQECLGSMHSIFKHNLTLYDVLVEAYPEILEQKLLFKWEWNQFNHYNDDILIEILREFVFYRINTLINDPIRDIPHYLNSNFVKLYCTKIQKLIDKKYFNNYYEWACKSFPEYANNWTLEDFGICVAFDGSICGSLEERFLYEFLKLEMNLNHIKAIGNKRSGKYTFIPSEESEDKKYCPDFVVEYLDYKGKKIKLKKPIIIEYYGMYNEKYNTSVMTTYRQKTKRKNTYYKNLDSIYFIDIYPKDLQSECLSLKTKINKLIKNIEKIRISA